MPAQTKAVIKGYFNKGRVPTELNYVDLVDSYLDAGGQSLDSDKVDGLHAAETGANAHVLATDSSGNGKLNGDIFPQSRVNGLNSRFERLFGSDCPSNPYAFSSRVFGVDNFAANYADFHQNYGSPYTLSAPFSWYSTPGGSYIATGQNYRSFLDMQNYSGTPLTLQWTSASAYSNIVTMMAINFNGWPSDNYIGEIRGWDVQNPGASDKYYAVRFATRGSSSPQGVFNVGLFYGTGVTFAIGDGTLVGMWLPITAGLVYQWQLGAYSGPMEYLLGKVAEGLPGIDVSYSVAGYPTSFKTVRWNLPGGNYVHFLIDSINVQ